MILFVIDNIDILDCIIFDIDVIYKYLYLFLKNVFGWSRFIFTGIHSLQSVTHVMNSNRHFKIFMFAYHLIATLGTTTNCIRSKNLWLSSVDLRTTFIIVWSLYFVYYTLEWCFYLRWSLCFVFQLVSRVSLLVDERSPRAHIDKF